eukprot:7382738-Prymnesium_polylepis.1
MQIESVGGMLPSSHRPTLGTASGSPARTAAFGHQSGRTKLQPKLRATTTAPALGRSVAGAWRRLVRPSSAPWRSLSAPPPIPRCAQRCPAAAKNRHFSSPFHPGRQHGQAPSSQNRGILRGPGRRGQQQGRAEYRRRACGSC